jgi:diguanylate cyclase (GGDEF)-like protein
LQGEPNRTVINTINSAKFPVGDFSQVPSAGWGITDRFERGFDMSDLAQNKTHRNHQGLAARIITREHRVFGRSSPEYITAQRASEDDSWRPLPLEEIRRQHIRRVLDACQGNRGRAAQLLGIGRTSLYRFLKRSKKKLAAASTHLHHLAATDALTGLANYRMLSQTIKLEIKRSDRTGRDFAVLIFDLTAMKGINEINEINENAGYQVGDRALCRLAELFHFSCRSIDTVAWYRADQFAIILPETGVKEAGAVARRIRKRLSNEREEPLLSVSVGIAVYPEDCSTMDAFLRRIRM